MSGLLRSAVVNSSSSPASGALPGAPGGVCEWTVPIMIAASAAAKLIPRIRTLLLSCDFQGHQKPRVLVRLNHKIGRQAGIERPAITPQCRDFVALHEVAVA